MKTVQQNGRFTLFLVNSTLIYILFSLDTVLPTKDELNRPPLKSHPLWVKLYVTLFYRMFQKNMGIKWKLKNRRCLEFEMQYQT